MAFTPGVLGTPLSDSATKVLLLGAGELGKEVAIELQRLGAEVIAVDRYPNAPAMQVAHRSHVVDMLDAAALRAVLAAEAPDVVIPEIEAIATAVLAEVEAGGVRVVPTARATQLTMDREGIRRLAAEELGIPTSPYRFVDTLDELTEAVDVLGLPCVLKPVMSSSGKGQSVLRTPEDLVTAWDYAQSGSRTGTAARCIVEGFVRFDSEITLLTVRHVGGTDFCDPIGHIQVDGDYRESWQPAALPPAALAKAKEVAAKVTDALGGWGLFGVELFIVGEDVLFSEVSPRPHDTGLVTLVSQDLSEFALHARAVLGLPAGGGTRLGGPDAPAAASCAVLAEGTGVPRFTGVDAALAGPTAQLRLFGKPAVAGRRRVAVTLARGADVEQARQRARDSAAALSVHLD
ncbi:formate-dependent phosphoribosylglycinamide formyltransferase [Propionicimonas paludicola]|uniref:Formate-dependent phosphoribosylglycinamide formyltransferase n=1 Tax=Propionicimonas paludicola TaxID=185243 RepID=A0A2A9CWY8_9ACTN|nr:formate-dependent phosphoribosylglycinamide formyltransferase [Propionicimonas paludicola]PFG18089.1 formate-dependent phosphoribosylglycinamide formyltransferase [Propionicimonas paludicola]